MNSVIKSAPELPNIGDFITQPQEDKQVKPVEEKPQEKETKALYDLSKLYETIPPIEKKTKRLQLIIKPSIYHALKKECTRQKISMNDFIGRLLEAVLIGK